MIARWLRCCLAAEVAAWTFTWALLVGGAGLRPVVAAVAALAAVLGVNGGVVVIKYALSRRHAFAPPNAWKISTWRALRTAVGEASACVVAFGVIQPFEQWWMGSDATGRLAPGRMPVLLIHGYLCNRGLWWRLRHRLREKGIAAATINLEPPLGSIDAFAARLAPRIEALAAETGADRVILIGHSMGGLVARAYLRRYGPARVAKLITIATPHHGSWAAYFALGRNAKEMQPDSAWMRQLASDEPLPVPTLSIWSARDGTVVPQDSARLAGAREKVVLALGHHSMTFAPEVMDAVQAELAIPIAS